MRKIGVKYKESGKILYYPKKNHRTFIQILKLLAKTDYLTTQQIATILGRRWPYPHKRMKTIMKDLLEYGYCQEYAILSNPNHICDNCNKSFRYLAYRNTIEDGLENLEQNRKIQEKAKMEKDYDPKKFFHCKEGYILGRFIYWLQCKGCNKHLRAHLDDEYKIGQDRLWSLTDNGSFAAFVILSKRIPFEFIKKKIDNKTFKMIFFLIKARKKDYVQRLVLALKHAFIIKPNVLKVVEDWYDEMVGVILGIKDFQDPDFKKFQREINTENIRKMLVNSRRRYR